MLSSDIRYDVTKSDELLRENNEILRQTLSVVSKILAEMETMNEMTRKRLPYKWITGEQDRELKGN